MKKSFIILSIIFSLLVFNSYFVMGIVFNQVDTTAPVTSITIDQANGDNGWYIPVGGDETTPSVHLSCTDEEGGSGVASIYYKWDNDEGFFSSDLSSVDVPITVTGGHYLYYYCADNLNNQVITMDRQGGHRVKNAALIGGTLGSAGLTGYFISKNTSPANIN